MSNVRLPFLALVFVCILLATHALVGQVIAITQAPPPPPPPAGAPGSPLTPAPPPPMGLLPEQLPRFEVASVKKFEGRVTSSSLRTPGGGRISITNLPLRTILTQAWGGIREYQLGGVAPGWMTTDRFTINAKAETNVPRDQVMLMLRGVLVDRFQLKYHVEKKEQQVYVLTTAEAEWKPTPRMKVVDCSQRGAKPPDGPAPVPIRIDQACSGGIMLSTNGIQARGTTMANFVNMLSSLGGLGVIHDKTGLTGTYTIELDASPTALLRSLSSSLASLNLNSGENLLPNVAEGRSLGAAIKDLGLKLDRQKEMIEVLIIDSVSQPDED